MSDFFSLMPDIGALMEFSRWRKGQPDFGMRVKAIQTPPPDTIAAVILSPSVNDPLAKATDEMLAKWDRVFVTGISPYFNESRYFNAGIEAALKMDPKWIVIMCDDLKETEHFGSLVRHLVKLDNREYDTIWIEPRPDWYHSCDVYLTRISRAQALTERMIGNGRLMDFRKKFRVDKIVTPKHPIAKPFRYWLFHTFYPAAIQNPKMAFTLTGDLCIVSAEWCRQNLPVFDDRFIGNQDVDLSLRLAKARSTRVDFQIGSEIGGHYQPSITKALKELFNLAILNELLREGHYR